MGEITGFLMSLVPLSLFASMGIQLFTWYNIQTQHFDVKEKIIEIIEVEGGLTDRAANKIDDLISNYPHEITYSTDISGEQDYGTEIEVTIKLTNENVQYESIRSSSAVTQVIR